MEHGVHSGRRSGAVRLGAFLHAELVEPPQLSQNYLAGALKCRRINEIVHSRSAISADRALRLVRYFAASDRYFLRLQENCDLRVVLRELAGRLEQITPRADWRVFWRALPRFGGPVRTGGGCSTPNRRVAGPGLAGGHLQSTLPSFTAPRADPGACFPHRRAPRGVSW